VRHFVQYHNPDKVGRGVETTTSLYVYTNKYLPALPIEGSVVWLVAGEGRPRRYFLAYWFVAETVEAADHPAFLHRIAGRVGGFLRPKARLDLLPWFPEFRRAQGNFAFGLNPLTASEWVEAFAELADEAGAPLTG
jgi:hypothetical protein